MGSSTPPFSRVRHRDNVRGFFDPALATGERPLRVSTKNSFFSIHHKCKFYPIVTVMMLGLKKDLLDNGLLWQDYEVCGVRRHARPDATARNLCIFSLLIRWLARFLGKVKRFHSTFGVCFFDSFA